MIDRKTLQDIIEAVQNNTIKVLFCGDPFQLPPVKETRPSTQMGYASGLLLFVPLGDRLERRKLIITMLAITALALFMAALSPSLSFLRSIWTGVCIAVLLLGVIAAIQLWFRVRRSSRV